MVIEGAEGKDAIRLRIETDAPEGARAALSDAVAQRFRHDIGLSVAVEASPVGTLPRSEKKTKRIFDNRQERES
jgi:phenylacetate-CoA ligase